MHGTMFLTGLRPSLVVLSQAQTYTLQLARQPGKGGVPLLAYIRSGWL
jgi:hypothetical protein